MTAITRKIIFFHHNHADYNHKDFSCNFFTHNHKDYSKKCHQGVSSRTISNDSDL